MSFVSHTRLHAMMLEILQLNVPSVRAVTLVPKSGPLVPGNWTLDGIDVPDADRAAADAVVAIETGRMIWVWCPDDSPLDGQIYPLRPHTPRSAEEARRNIEALFGPDEPDDFGSAIRARDERRAAEAAARRARGPWWARLWRRARRRGHEAGSDG